MSGGVNAEIAAQIRQRGIFALTLLHPWPFAVVHLGKRIENRRWRPSLSAGMWYAIHGGKAPSAKDVQKLIPYVEMLHRRNAPNESAPFVTSANCCLTGIVALAKHGGCVKESADPWFDGAPYIGWKMDDLFILEQPIPCRGAQGLWRVPDDVAEQLLKQLD